MENTPIQGTPHTRAMALYKAIRAVYKKSKIQYADAKYYERHEDTFYVHPDFFREAATRFSAAVLSRMDTHGYGIMDILPEHIRARVINWQSGARDNLGPRNAAAWRQAAITGNQPYRQIKDKERDPVEDPPIEHQAVPSWEWQDYNAEWWQRTGNEEADQAPYGDWRSNAPWRNRGEQSSASSSQATANRLGRPEPRRQQQSASSTSPTAPYQETSWNERSESWRQRDW